MSVGKRKVSGRAITWLEMLTENVSYCNISNSMTTMKLECQDKRKERNDTRQ